MYESTYLYIPVTAATEYTNNFYNLYQSALIGLVIWSILNLIVFGFFYFKEFKFENTIKYISQFSITWNIVNFIIGILGFVFFRIYYAKPIEASLFENEELILQRSTNILKIVALNIPLDIFYVAVGCIFLFGKNKEKVNQKGYGIGLLIQGIFLMLLDIGILISGIVINIAYSDSLTV